jgi:predicted transcriptional regulator
MGRLKKGSDSKQMKNKQMTIRIDADLRRRLETFAESGICQGEELQVIIRMLVRIGLEVEEKVAEMREAAIREMSLKGAAKEVPRSETSPRESRSHN